MKTRKERVAEFMANRNNWYKTSAHINSIISVFIPEFILNKSLKNVLKVGLLTILLLNMNV